MFIESHWLQLLITACCVLRVTAEDVTEKKIFANKLTVYQLTVTFMFHRIPVVVELRKWSVSRSGHVTAEEVTRCIRSVGEGVDRRIILRWIFRN